MNSIRFLAGASVVDITPPLSKRINGDFISHYTHTTHDKLYSKALALKSGEETVVLLVVDICYMKDDFFKSILKEVSQKTGLPEKNFLICCTHSHLTDLLLEAADLPFTRKLPGLIMESIFASLEKLVPAKISYGSADISDYIVCKRILPQKGNKVNDTLKEKSKIVKTNAFGTEDLLDEPIDKMDTLLTYLAVKDINDQWISLFANYSLHNIGDFEQCTISANYFGEFVSQIKHVLKAGDDFIGILSKGTSWKSSIWDFLNNGHYPKGDFEKGKLIAKSLAKHIAASMNELVWNNEIDISTEYEKLYLCVTKPSQQELEDAIKVVEESNYENITIVDNDILRKIYRREHVLLSQKGEKEILSLQVINIGNCVIGTLAGEFFIETDMWIKQISQLKNFHPQVLSKKCRICSSGNQN